MVDWRERKKVLETFYIKWNFVMNVNCDGNENICEATVTIILQVDKL